MRSTLFRLTSRPTTPHLLPRAQPRLSGFLRPLSSSATARLKEDAPQDPEAIEKAKQAQLKDGEKKEALESSSESAVRADRDGKDVETLQKETASKQQKEHPQGKS